MPTMPTMPTFRTCAFAPLALIMFVPLLAPALGEGARTDPGAIDAAVEAFTGAKAGSAGGAIAPADRRLRLAACAGPLEAKWHGTGRSTVRVECPGPSFWRVFVALAGSPASASASGSGPGSGPQPAVIKRGDPVTVMIRGRGFTVQQSGEAMEAGREGEWIGIRLASDVRAGTPGGRAEPVRARIVRPGLAVIPIGPGRLAHGGPGAAAAD